MQMQMQPVRRQAIEALRRRLVRRSPPPSSRSFTALTRPSATAPRSFTALTRPWAATQTRAAKMLGSDVTPSHILLLSFPNRLAETADLL